MVWPHELHQHLAPDRPADLHDQVLKDGPRLEAVPPQHAVPGDRQVQRPEHAGCDLSAGNGRRFVGPGPDADDRRNGRRRRACGRDPDNGVGRPGAAGGGRPPAPPAPLPVGRCGRARQRADLFLGHRDVPFPAGEDGVDSLLHLLGEQALGPGRRVQLRGDPELLGAGHAELAQGVDGDRGANVAQAREHLLSNAEMLA